MKPLLWFTVSIVMQSVILYGQSGCINNTLGVGGSFKVKSTASDSLLVVKENGNIGVGTANPAEKLDLNGNLNVRGSIAVNSVTRYYSIAGAELQLWNNTGFNYQKDNELVFGLNSSQTHVFFTPIHLPNGVTITQVDGYVVDSDVSQNINFSFQKSTSTLASGLTSGSIGSSTITLSSLSETVDNANYTYVLKIYWTTTASPMRLQFQKAKITYLVSNPIP